MIAVANSHGNQSKSAVMVSLVSYKLVVAPRQTKSLPDTLNQTDPVPNLLTRAAP